MSNFRRGSNVDQNVHFSKAVFGETERSEMYADPVLITAFNAGDIVPIYCREILPEQGLSLGLKDMIIRQTTLKTPTMGSMYADIYAFWVPNRVVNQSWKAVMGENLSGSWTANSISLAPLVSSSSGTVVIPVGSVADYYGFSSEAPMPRSVLALCHDLKFRGYVAIYNEFFRNQNYQPPVPMSTLNVYQGFLDSDSSNVSLDGSGYSVPISSLTVSDGSYGAGAIAESLYGSGRTGTSFVVQPALAQSGLRFRATHAPFKANKRHDYFTSVLPSPQKSPSTVFAPVTGNISFVAPVTTSSTSHSLSTEPLRWSLLNGTVDLQGMNAASIFALSSDFGEVGAFNDGTIVNSSDLSSESDSNSIVPSNLYTSASNVPIAGAGIDISDIRMASAIQQVYEVLARGGSRYRSIVMSFFGVEVEDPFCDAPVLLGHFSRELELYQTAQTSASESGSTAQGNLAAFGYTATGGHLFSHRFVEHGYVHVFCVVRHRNIYTSYLSRDNFRRSMLDFYFPQLANISEQPVYTREINPFYSDSEQVFGYQEAWAEYRFEPDQVSGYMRSGVDESLSPWTYVDQFNSSLAVSNSEWLKSNSQQVLDNTLAITSSLTPQFKAFFRFGVDKDLPMPVFSAPGLDII
ncbi:major capsid protein [Sigmofec virus UA08Rod_5530]|uniref:Major capsid protein n=1 Tax=Sigmofec virus UA08Rod_5530 TaxID=2929427 RepID=A0A976N1A5_9VIRU|nr:major capsid protein [Sigmofec virus UA08Rod_5530]